MILKQTYNSNNTQFQTSMTSVINQLPIHSW